MKYRIYSEVGHQQKVNEIKISKSFINWFDSKNIQDYRFKNLFRVINISDRNFNWNVNRNFEFYGFNITIQF